MKAVLVATVLLFFVANAAAHTEPSGNHVHYPDTWNPLAYLYDLEAALATLAMIVFFLLVLPWPLIMNSQKWANYMYHVKGDNSSFKSIVVENITELDAKTIENKKTLSPFSPCWAACLFVAYVLVIGFFAGLYNAHLFQLEILEPVVTDASGNVLDDMTDPTLAAALAVIGSQHWSYYAMFTTAALIMAFSVFRNVLWGMTEHSIESVPFKFRCTFVFNILIWLSVLLFAIFGIVASTAISTERLPDDTVIEESGYPTGVVIGLIIVAFVWVIMDLIVMLIAFCITFVASNSVLAHYYHPVAGYLGSYSQENMTNATDKDQLKAFANVRGNRRKQR